MSLRYPDPRYTWDLGPINIARGTTDPVYNLNFFFLKLIQFAFISAGVVLYQVLDSLAWVCCAMFDNFPRGIAAMPPQFSPFHRTVFRSSFVFENTVNMWYTFDFHTQSMRKPHLLNLSQILWVNITTICEVLWWEQSWSWTQVTVVKWCKNKWNGQILVYIYHKKQCNVKSYKNSMKRLKRPTLTMQRQELSAENAKKTRKLEKLKRKLLKILKKVWPI